MEQDKGFSIKETSEQTELTEDTIRYYEKIGLLPRAERKANSHRVYSLEDIKTMKLISCLKKTDMSLDEMRPYLSMSFNDDLTEYPELYELMLNHKKKIQKQMASLQLIIDTIDSRLQPGKPDNPTCTITQETKRMPKAKK